MVAVVVPDVDVDPVGFRVVVVRFGLFFLVVPVAVVAAAGVVWACAGTTTDFRMGLVHDDGRIIAPKPATPVALSTFLRVAPASRELSDFPTETPRFCTS